MAPTTVDDDAKLLYLIVKHMEGKPNWDDVARDMGLRKDAT